MPTRAAVKVCSKGIDKVNERTQVALDSGWRHSTTVLTYCAWLARGNKFPGSKVEAVIYYWNPIPWSSCPVPHTTSPLLTLPQAPSPFSSSSSSAFPTLHPRMSLPQPGPGLELRKDQGMLRVHNE